MKVLIVLIIILAIVALAQIMKVYNLSSKLRGKNEADISEDETKFNATLLIVFMVVFMVSSVYMMFVFPNTVTGPSASEHGVEIDWLYGFNWIILLVVFFITQPILFIFAAKYRKKEGVRATFFAHSNKLELVWTVIPAIVLAAIIIFGLNIWNQITEDRPEETQKIEIYAYQFGWTARYAGEDNKLGKSDFKVLDPSTNPLGIITKEILLQKDSTWQERIKSLNNNLEEGGDLLPNSKVAELKTDIARIERQIKRLKPLIEAQTNANDSTAYDDVIVKELCLIKNKEYEFKFRSRDVIHSAFFPHFRAQMNCVPGMVTKFSFKPIYTTEEMRKMPEIKEKYEKINKKRIEKGEEPVEFDYILLCNKICGASHYNMQMKITVVENKADYKRWYLEKAGQNSFAAGLGWSQEDIAELYGVMPSQMFDGYKPITTNLEDTIQSDIDTVLVEMPEEAERE